MLNITSARKEIFDVANLCSELVQAIQSACDEKSISLQNTTTSIGMEGDTTQLYQVLLNLAKNSIEAMPSGGTLSFHSERADFLNKNKQWVSGLKVTVADTGIGIPEDIQSKIFDAYFSHGKYQSTGLGLSLSLQIIDQHGGMIDFISTPNQGASFFLYLPVKELV